MQSQNPARRGTYRNYPEIASPWFDIGYTAVPGRRGRDKAPEVKFGGYIGADRRAPTPDELEDWGGLGGYRNAFLLMDPVREGAPHLHVIDVDDPTLLAWAIETFGPTPLTVSTGREGGGVHLYYRAPDVPDVYAALEEFDLRALLNGWLGPEDSPRKETGNTPIDLRLHSSYVVAPGSIHNTGRVYQPNWDGVAVGVGDLILDRLRSLPVLDYETLSREIAKERARRGLVSMDASGVVDLGGWKGSRGPSTKADPETAILPRASQCHGGLTVAEVVRRGLLSRGEQVPTGCPHHDSQGHRSATLRITDGGWVSLTCHSRCGRTYRYGHADWFRGGRGGSGGRGSGHENSECIPKVSRGHETIRRLHLGAERLVHGRYLDLGAIKAEVEGARVLVAQTGTGSGKTRLAADCAKHAQRKGVRVVGVAPLRALVSQLAGRLDVLSYLDIGGGLSGDVAVCAPSLRRVEVPTPGVVWLDRAGEPEPDPVGLLVVDEIEQVLRQCRSSLGSRTAGRTTWTNLVSLIRAVVADRGSVLLLDAHAGPLTRRLLAEAGVEEATLWLTAEEPGPREHVVYGDHADWLATVLADAEALGEGEYLGVVSQSATKAATLAKLLDRRGIPRLLVSGDTALDLDLARLDEQIAERPRGVVILTPAANSGVSIETPVTRVYAWVEARVGTSRDVAQMIARFRQPSDPTIHLAGVKAKRPNDPSHFDADVIASRWCKGDENARAVIQAEWPADLYVHDGKGWQLRSEAASFVRLCAEGLAEDRRQGDGWTLAAYLGWQRGLGATLRTCEVDVASCVQALEAEARRAREVVKEEEAEAIADAAVDGSEAEDIRSRGPRTCHEERQLRHASIAGFFDAEVTADLVKLDKRGKLRRSVRDLVHTVAASQPKGADLREAVAGLDRADLSGGRTLPHDHEHRLLRGAARGAYLRAALGAEGVAAMCEAVLSGHEASELDSKRSRGHPDPTDGRVGLTVERATEAQVWATTYRARGGVVDNAWEPPRADEVSPLRPVLHVLRSLGIPIASERRQVGKLRTRHYWIDLAALRAHVSTYVAAYLGRVLTPHEAGEPAPPPLAAGNPPVSLAEYIAAKKARKEAERTAGILGHLLEGEAGLSERSG